MRAAGLPEGQLELFPEVRLDRRLLRDHERALQARYDETLAGTPGVVVTAKADDQERTLFSTAVADGQPLRTTLDEDLQRAAEEALDGVGPASAVVALRPSTGEILAAASGAGSDGYNTATFGQYAPGSTMKVVSSPRTGSPSPAGTASCGSGRENSRTNPTWSRDGGCWLRPWEPSRTRGPCARLTG